MIKLPNILFGLLFILLIAVGVSHAQVLGDTAVVQSSAIVEREVPILDSEARVKRMQRYTTQEVQKRFEHDERIARGRVISLAGGSAGLLNADGRVQYAQVERDGEVRLADIAPEHLQHEGSCQSPFHDVEQREAFAQEYSERSQQLAATLRAPESAEATTIMREVELLAVAPGDFIAGRSEQDAIDDILFAVEGANLYYRPLGVQIRLTAIQVHTPGPQDPFAYAAESQNAITMLDRLRAEWLFRQEPRRDATVVFASSSFRQVFGLAYPASSCLFPEFAYGFVSKGGAKGAQSRANLASTLAHELGHILGMSHDATLTAVGPSVMWPTFSATPAGFSEFSQKEFQDHVANGGASCFTETVDDQGAGVTIPIVPGTIQSFTMREGQSLELDFVDPSQPFVTYFIVEGLPEGALFDPSTGHFFYSPTSGVVFGSGGSRVLRFTLQMLGSAAAPMEVAIRVLDVNTPPRITLSHPEEYQAQIGRALTIGAVVEDIDLPFDTLGLRLTNEAQVQRYPGTPRVFRNATSTTVHWTPTQEGSYQFRFLGSDSAGASVTRNLTVHVRGGNPAPGIEVEEVVQLQGAQTFFTVNGFDPQNEPIQLKVDGLPAGAVVERFANSWRVDFSKVSQGEKELQLRFRISDGSSEVSKLVQVFLADLSPTETALWPGVAQSIGSAPQKGMFLYEGSRGIWQQRSCGGNLIEQFQFGGLVGDAPLLYEEKGIRYPALFRTINGQGVFIVQQKQERKYIAWGLAGDVPILADFDGDDISDFAVYRPTTRQWFISFSQLAPQVLNDMSQWGNVISPAAADVDGDGLADRILFIRGAQGEVFADVRLATGRQFLIGVAELGLQFTAEPFVGDIDLDGRADLMLRASSGDLMGIRSASTESFVEKGFAQGARVVYSGCTYGDMPGLSTLSRYQLLPSSEFPSFFDELPREGELLELYQMRQHSGALRRPATDVDGDFISDLSVWRPIVDRGVGSWLSLGSQRGEYRSPWSYGEQAQPVAFAFESERGRSFVQYESGIWRFSGPNANEYEVRWGEPGDVAVAGDYNGDTFGDLAVYRPKDGTWWITYGPSFHRAVKVDFGGPGDIPVPADFDGDGGLELAVYRPSSGAWFIRYADGGVSSFSFGLDGDVPIPADYLGEGRAQIAVWRPSTGMWYLLREETELVSRQWGLPGDIPLALDRNGDGRMEPSVWRPSTGTWYSRGITDGNDIVYSTQYGLPDDLPVGPLWLKEEGQTPEILE